MKLLLDTYTMPWLIVAAESDKRIGAQAKRFISWAETVHASSKCIVKARLIQVIGKLDLNKDFIRDITAVSCKHLSYDFRVANIL